MEMTPLNKTLLKTLGIPAAAAALALFGYAAQAQAPKAETAPATKAAPKKPAAPPKCNTLKTQAPCEARADCTWVAESKDAKGKVKAKAYCRAKPTTPAKKK
jgi:hypothetical protein